MTQYEELLRDENAVLRKRIAFLEENSTQTVVDPQIQSELEQTKTKNIELLSDIQKYKQQIVLLTNKVNQLTDQLSTLSSQYDNIDFTQLFIDKFTKQTHSIYLGKVDKNKIRHYDDDEWYDLHVQQHQSYYDKFGYHAFMLLADGKVITIPYKAVKEFDMDEKINSFKRAMSNSSELYNQIYNNNFTPPSRLSPNSFIDNKELNEFIIDTCRQIGFQFEGKGISSGNVYCDNLYPEYQSKEHNLTFSASYITQSKIKKEVYFTITPRDIIENYTKLKAFILYENPLFSKFLRHEINQYFNHTIVMSNDNKTTTVLNKDNEVVYQETLVSECIKESNNLIQTNNIPSSSNEDMSSQPTDYTKWTQEEIELLKQLTSQNVPPHEITKNPNIHKTYSAICNKLHVLRTNNEIPSSPLRIDGWTPEDDDIIIQMFNNKETPEQIASILNRSKSAINHRIVRLRAAKKLPPEDKTILHSTGQKSIWANNEEDVETIKRLIKEGYRVKDMLPHLSHEYTYAQVSAKVNHLKNLKKSKL
jgi:predicted transcriptional regulator